MKNRSFRELQIIEAKIVKKYNEGELPYFMHMCGGNEIQLINIFKQINKGDYIKWQILLIWTES